MAHRNSLTIQLADPSLSEQSPGHAAVVVNTPNEQTYAGFGPASHDWRSLKGMWSSPSFRPQTVSWSCFFRRIGSTKLLNEIMPTWEAAMTRLPSERVTFRLVVWARLRNRKPVRRAHRVTWCASQRGNPTDQPSIKVHPRYRSSNPKMLSVPASQRRSMPGLAAKISRDRSEYLRASRCRIGYLRRRCSIG